jgi:DNA-binding SARP family transcriptional activator
MLRWAVLGPLRVSGPHGVVALGGSTLQAFVAVLLAAEGRTVSVDVLADLIWGDRPPRSSTSSLQVTASRVRRALGGYAGRLESWPGGYRLAIETDLVDVVEARRALACGRDRLPTDPEGAAEVFAAALDLWEGPPLLGLAGFPLHARLTNPWHDLRLDLMEARNDALLAAGRPHEVAGLAGEQAFVEPWRERLTGQQMLALYRCSRQAEALAVFDRHRRRMADELGIAPCPRLAELHLQILRQDPSLLVG